MHNLDQGAGKSEGPDRIERGRRIGEILGIAAVGLLFASVYIVDVFHPFTEKFLEDSLIHKIAQVEPTVLASVLLVYVLFERWRILGPAKKTIDEIETRSRKLNAIPTSHDISALLDGATARVVDQLSGKSMVRINETAEDTYKHILHVLGLVERAKPSVVKCLSHGVFHASGATDVMTEDDQPYFADFQNKMRAVSESSEANRWNVRVLYNVTHFDRLNVILKHRLDLGKVGYKVRAMCFRDFYPVFSPMIIDDDHVFLAVFEEGKTRVSQSVYIRGEKAAEFFAGYFDALWADDRVKKLREDGRVFPDGIEALTLAVNGKTSIAP